MEIHYQDYYEMTKSRNTLFIIDPQNDFHPGGSLAIPTANEDSSRISKLIMEHGDQIDDIIVSLDSHQKLHIAHSLFWVNAAGEHPPPFTPIPLAAVENGEWKTSQPKWQDWGLAYVKQLEANKRFTLLIWPEVHKIKPLPLSSS
jgi:nicotinamidase/pyrazinamidase